MMDFTEDELVEIERMADYHAAIVPAQSAPTLKVFASMKGKNAQKLVSNLIDWGVKSFDMWMTISTKARNLRKKKNE